MGGGGISGAVAFPGYVSDSHADLMSGAVTDHKFKYSETFDRVDQNVVEIMNAMWLANPWAGATFTSPSVDLAENESRYDLFNSFITDYSLSVPNVTSWITHALLQVTQPSTAIAPMALDVNASTATAIDAFTAFSGRMRTDLTSALALVTGNDTAGIDDLLAALLPAVTGQINNLQNTSPTTIYLGLVTTVLGKMDDANYVDKADILPLLAASAQYSKDILKVAVEVVKAILDSTAVSDLVTQYGAKREITFQSQAAQFAGTMADVNAVNSTGYLFGMALLRSEQMREVAEFDSQISTQTLNQGLSLYIQTHGASLSAGTQIDVANASNHNDILKTSLQLLGNLNNQGNAQAADLLRSYSQIFGANFGSEIARLNFVSALGANTQNNISEVYGRNIGLDFEADRLNKAAREARYAMGLQQVQQILVNKVEFERVATQIKTEQNRIKYVARSEYETATHELALRDSKWDMEVGFEGATIFAAPSGMARALPGTPSKLMTAIGVGLQIASIASGAGLLGGGKGGG